MNVILATLVTIVAEVPLVMVMVNVFAVGTALAILNALPAVAPDQVREKIEDVVMSLLVMTSA